MGRYTTGGVGRDVLAGAIAGGAAVWVINRMDWSLSHAGRAPAAPAATAPAHAAATKAADAAGVDVSGKQKQLASHTVHYGIGVGIGALYGLLRGMAPAVTTGRGSLFGVATFILGDEVGAPAMGLAKGPMDYPAGDHARSALAHVVFGLLTDLGTRLVSPWKDNVVIVRGPTLGERVEGGRQAISDGRDFVYDRGRPLLDQGLSYVERARELLQELDWEGMARKGGKQARRLAEQIRARLPEQDDVLDAVEEGRQRVRGAARRAAARLPDADDVSDAVERGRSRGRGWLRSLADQLPDGDDVDDAVETGRKHARKLAKRARGRLPERDDVDGAVAEGRKRVKRLADDAQDAGSSALGRVTRWLFG